MAGHDTMLEFFVVAPLDAQGDPCPGSFGRLLDGEHKLVETVGSSFTHISFVPHCFHIEPDTYYCMLYNFAADHSVLMSMSLLVSEQNGLDFMTCRERAATNWSQLLRACKEHNARLDISMNVTLSDAKSEETFDTLFKCPPDSRWEFLTILDIRDLYKSKAESLLTKPEWIPTPTAFLLSKFPSLQTLFINESNVSDAVLTQLADTNKQLRSLVVIVQHVYNDRNLENTSHSAWRSLREECPGVELELSDAQGNVTRRTV